MNVNLFDSGVRREGTACEKWDRRGEVFGRSDVLPLWVADMDFAAPQPVIEALEARVRHGAFGYTETQPEDYSAVVSWMSRRHHVTVRPEWILFSPGVVDSLRVAVAALTKPGDSVIVFTPVYGPFYRAVEAAGCSVRRCPLINGRDGWTMDLNEVETALREGARLVALCNPHNPVGRVWTRAELEALVSLTNRYGAAIVSDEIHADLEMPGYRCTSILSVATNAIALISATKTFNLAALRHSSVIIPDERLRAAFRAEFSRRGINGINLFGMLAQRTAYEKGEAWLDELLAYLDQSRGYVTGFLADHLPMIRASRLEGTYLMWLDMRALGMTQDELMRFMVEKAALGLNSGTDFGPEGQGFMRMNLATPRVHIEQAMSQLESAVRGLGR